MMRASHPKKEVEEAIEHAENNGWHVEVKGGRGHAWGQIFCPYKDDECRCGIFCITSIWSTPKNPGNHAKDLKRVVNNCTTHKQQEKAAQADDGEKDGIRVHPQVSTGGK
jgi:hypothetical protein